MVRLTNEQAIEMMKAKLECMKRDVSGSDEVCNKKGCDNCYLNYAQGNMGEQQEWLRMGIQALENQKLVMDRQIKKQTMINKIKNLARVIKCYDCMTNNDDGNCEECEFYISPNREILALESLLEELKGE